MEEKKSGRLYVWMPLLSALILILGMTLGFKLRDTLRYKRDIQAIIQRNDRLEQIIDLIDERYVDTININHLYRDAVTGILSHLDPHTIYIPAEELEGVNEDLEGSFFGIGVEFYIIRDTIQVVSVVENGPAQKAGIAVGDKFIQVEDTVVAGTGITADGIISLLRGRKHTDVRIQIKDALKGQYRDVIVKRDVIPLYSIDVSLMLDTTTGYIRLSRFSATTTEEFMKAMKGLKAAGMRQLILDLRQNPGGFLEPAVTIADQFLDGDKLIVYTEGRRIPRESYNAGEQGMFEDGRLIVLVDETSASASEIVAGAVQDWDRGIVAGRRTFGKGLVQEQYNLDDGSALRLTIAKYFTPSGRSIQRSFSEGRQAYQDAFVRRFTSDALAADDTVAADTIKYYTNGKRVVYGGGGITPDVFIPYDTARLSSGLLTMIYSEELRNLVWDYYTTHREILRGYKDVKEFDSAFRDADEITANYLGMLSPSDRTAATRVLSQPAYLRYFQLHVKAQIARILFGNKGYYAISLQQDNAVQKALQLIYSERYSEIIGR
jgi:carboxyl-terminal processing protease